ncbi:MAG: flavodoxin family protein [Armatimonadetes bacterium]|nr:flavodoxin family protein [Armatimonadota bacterium]
MKAVAIMGSPHGMKGNTAKLLEPMLEAMKEAGAEVETLLLGKLKVAPCVGCDACHKGGKCAINDDFDQVLQAILDADMIVLASPNYIFSVSAQMKALFDRCCGPIHIQQFAGKFGAAVVTSGGGGCTEVEDYMLRFLRMAGAWTVGSTGAEAFKLMDPSQAPQAVEAARELGRKLVAAVQSGEPPADQVEEHEQTAQFMRQIVSMRKDDWQYEYEYWQKLDAV